MPNVLCAVEGEIFFPAQRALNEAHAASAYFTSCPIRISRSANFHPGWLLYLVHHSVAHVSEHKLGSDLNGHKCLTVGKSLRAD
jgi:hypothetical protein